jgi:hypothetical protein
VELYLYATRTSPKRGVYFCGTILSNYICADSQHRIQNLSLNNGTEIIIIIIIIIITTTTTTTTTIIIKDRLRYFFVIPDLLIKILRP